MAFTVFIEGTERTDLTFLPGGGNLRYSLTTQSVGSASLSLFAVDDGAGAYRPAIGDILVVKIGGVDLYNGAILEMDERAFTDAESGWDVGVLLTLTISDQNRLPGYALYTKTYETGTTLKAILQDLVAGPLAPYSITLDAGQATGPALTTNLTYTDAYCLDILNALQGLTAWPWRLSPALVLSMIEPGVVSSGITLQDSDTDIIGGLSFRRSRLANYANSVLLRFSSVALTAQGFLGTSANFTNGETVTLGSTTYSFQTTLTDVAGNVKIGASANASLSHLIAAIMRGAGNGTEYAEATIANSSAIAYFQNTTTMKALARADGAAGNATVCTETAAHASWYTEGYIPITTLVGGADQSLTITTTDSDPTALAADGYPIWRAYTDGTITDPALATVDVAARLRRAIAAGAQVVSVTHRRGIAYVGETVSLSFAEHAISGVHMIVSVDISDDMDGEALYTFSCVAGNEMPDTWLDYFRSGGGSSSGSGGSTATSGSSSSSSTKLVGSGGAFLGGTDYVQSPTPTWVPASGGSTSLETNPFRVRLDTVARGGESATIRGCLRALTAGVTIQARLYNVTDHAACPGVSAVITTSGFVAFVATLTAGAKDYELQLLAGSANEDVNAVAYLE